MEGRFWLLWGLLFLVESQAVMFGALHFNRYYQSPEDAQIAKQINEVIIKKHWELKQFLKFFSGVEP